MQNHNTKTGRFVPGNNAHKNRAAKAAYLQIVYDEVDLPAWRQVVNKALLDAQAGCRHARAWLSDNLVGVPVRNINLTGQAQNKLNAVIAEMAAQGLEAGELFDAMMAEIVANKKDTPHD
jgi:predicted ATP-binding protein involved in virulence